MRLRITLIIANVLAFVSLGFFYYLSPWGMQQFASLWCFLVGIGLVFSLVFIISSLKKTGMDSRLTKLISITNILGIGVLGTLYYFAFDLRWGINWQALTWGLPLLAGIVIILLDIIFMIKKQNWKRGLRGFGIGWAVFIYTVVILWFFSYMIVGPPHNGPKETAPTDENRIMALLINTFWGKENGHFFSEHEYVVIDPSFVHDYFDQELLTQFKKYMNNKNMVNQKYFDMYLEDINKTFEKFQASEPEILHVNLKSSPQNGYYIDYDGKFNRYFSSPDAGWLRWRLFRPGAAYSIQFSSPVYDPETGIFIIEIGTQSASLAGSGHAVLFKIVNNQLITLMDIETWVS